MNVNFIKKVIVAFLLVSTLGTATLPTETHAQRAVTVVGDRSATGVKTMVESTISATAESLQVGLQTSLNIKELSLDGIAYGLTRKIIQSMVRSIVTWINSGFQGSPAFMTDLGGFLRDIADEVIGETIYGSDLAFLCSPFSLDIKIALATQYNSTQDGYQPQCTLSQVTDNIEGFVNGSFGEGGWGSWFELTQGSSNDPNKAFFESTLTIDAAIRDAQGKAIKELEFGDGFLSFKVCSDTQAQSGAQKNCTITTPGRVIADQLNKALGAGQDSLITADEINEIIGALLAQLAQQALTGIHGLLGMGGNSAYGSNTYGAEGRQSFLDALEDEDVVLSSSSPLVGQDFAKQIALENDYLDVQYEVVARVQAARATYNSNKSEADNMTPVCRISEFPTAFTQMQTTAQAEITKQTTIVTVLTELDSRFKNASSSSAQGELMKEFLRLQGNNSFTTATELVQADLNLEFKVILEIEEFEAEIESQLADCDRSGNNDS